MKFAMIVDGCVQRSYRMIDGKSYKLKSDNLEPYGHHHSLSNECHLGIWGWPSVFKDGYFINWTEWDELPNLDLDIVMVALEKQYDKYNVDMLRKAYPNAIIVSFFKEAHWTNYSHEQRIDFFKACDYITFPWNVKKDSNGILGIETLELLTGKKVYYMPQPHNINYLHDHYYKEDRNYKILNYKSPERGNDNSIIDQISKKYGIASLSHVVKYRGPDHKQWEEFLDGMHDVTYCFNLDETLYGGSMGVQCAALGILNFGGVQDSHTIFWPDLATNDHHELEKQFNLYYNNQDIHHKAVEYAFNEAQNIYGYEAIHDRFLKMIKE
tara:strand:+ start:16 stop:990 length:975 start_codon:yes stop_codon:yes gene_type:complete